MTALILFLGLAAVALVLLSPERRRERRVAKLSLGQDGARVESILGAPPATCTTGSLEHLAHRFPTGTPPAAAEDALQRMQRETAERWVYPLHDDEPAGCVPRAGATEVGLDEHRRVLWYVPVTGKVAIVVPEEFVSPGAK